LFPLQTLILFHFSEGEEMSLARPLALRCRGRLSEPTFYTWRKRYGWLSGRTGEGRGADVTRRQVNAPLRKLVEPYLAIEFVKGATSDSAVVALSAARLHGYFGLLKKSSKSRRRRAHSLVVFGPQRSTERH
jgi:hypothetical protein